MAENSKIEWCTHTWNPWFGCKEVSSACDHCYARALMQDRLGRVEWGGNRVRTSAENWAQPLKWDRVAAKAGRIDTVFCLSLGDIWDNDVDPQWRRQAFEVMKRTPNLLYLLLSKRIGNALRMCGSTKGLSLPRNAALGATLADQPEWDRDLPKLLDAAMALGARFTFASVEPMLGPIVERCGNFPSWTIIGGESGSSARPYHYSWAHDLIRQCAAAGVPVFHKQVGAHPIGFDGHRVFLRDRKGGDPALWPEVLRVREMPQ